MDDAPPMLKNPPKRECRKGGPRAVGANDTKPLFLLLLFLFW